MIEEYDFGRIKIDGKEYTHDVIISKDGIQDWWRKTSHNVDPEDISDVVEKKPPLLIIGTGHDGCMDVPKETVKFIQDKGIKVIMKLTAEAVKEFNNSKDDTIAALHLTC